LLRCEVNIMFNYDGDKITVITDHGVSIDFHDCGGRSTDYIEIDEIELSVDNPNLHGTFYYIKKQIMSLYEIMNKVNLYYDDVVLEYEEEQRIEEEHFNELYNLQLTGR